MGVIKGDTRSLDSSSYEASGNLMRVAKLGWLFDGAPNHRPYLENPEVLLLIPRIMQDFSIYTGIP